MNDLNSIKSYLHYAKAGGKDLDSTVGRGLFYEFVAFDFLQRHLNVKNLQQLGGANDKGVDLSGKWDLSLFPRGSDIPKQRVKSKLITPFLGRKDASVSLRVQCKNYKKNIDPKVIREIVGTHSSLPTAQKNKIIFMVFAPRKMSTQAITLFMDADVPLVYIQMDPLKLAPDGDPYELSHYMKPKTFASLQNHYAGALLAGVDWETSSKESLGRS